MLTKCVFLTRETINQKQTTIIYHPLNLERDFDELLEVLKLLQTADTFSVATPADWRQDDIVIVPTTGSCRVAKDRMEGKEEMKCYD